MLTIVSCPNSPEPQRIGVVRWEEFDNQQVEGPGFSQSVAEEWMGHRLMLKECLRIMLEKL